MRYKRMLVANRGEIAMRIIKALKEMGIEAIAVYSKVDKELPYTRVADQKICIGKSNAKESYLDTYKILSAATVAGCDSIHPGIGFLAENSNFANLCKKVGIDFIGPSPENIETMGNKKKAKEIAELCGVPIVKGNIDPVKSADECIKIADEIGYPILLKAAYGGGGKGIRTVYSKHEMETNYRLCVKEAQAAFGNSEMIVEQYLENTRHVEVQILGDIHGNVIQLGDRECTIQRTKQKVIEEAPCQNIKGNIRENLQKDAVKLAKKIGYIGPGTVEFLVLPDGSYYFLEMNTRLQVEHTITELITGIDLVKEQIRVCSGEKLQIKQENINLNGYALQARIMAESAENGFQPSFGKIEFWHMPGGAGVRVDSGYMLGAEVTPYYDSLLTKICCHDVTKELAVRKMIVAMKEIEISGIESNIKIIQRILNDSNFLCGNYDENYLENIAKCNTECVV